MKWLNCAFSRLKLSKSQHETNEFNYENNISLSAFQVKKPLLLSLVHGWPTDIIGLPLKIFCEPGFSIKNKLRGLSGTYQEHNMQTMI